MQQHLISSVAAVVSATLLDDCVCSVYNSEGALAEVTDCVAADVMALETLPDADISWQPSDPGDMRTLSQASLTASALLRMGPQRLKGTAAPLKWCISTGRVTGCH
jgi:hypothetical protein